MAPYPKGSKYSGTSHYKVEDIIQCCQEQYAAGTRIAAVRAHVAVIPARYNHEDKVTQKQRDDAVLDYSLSCLYPAGKFEHPFAIVVIHSKALCVFFLLSSCVVTVLFGFCL